MYPACKMHINKSSKHTLFSNYAVVLSVVKLKMADGAVVSRSLWLSHFIFYSFCTNDGVSITLHAKDLFETETFAFSSLFVQKKSYSKFKPNSLLCLLIII